LCTVVSSKSPFSIDYRCDDEKLLS
jgi:hypothetical protein